MRLKLVDRSLGMFAECYLVKRAWRSFGVAQLEKTIEDRLVSADKSYAVVVVVRSASERGCAMALSPD